MRHFPPRGAKFRKKLPGLCAIVCHGLDHRPPGPGEVRTGMRLSLCRCPRRFALCRRQRQVIGAGSGDDACPTKAEARRAHGPSATDRALSSRPEAVGCSGEIWLRTCRVPRLRPTHRPEGQSFRPKDRLGNGATSMRGQMSRLRCASLDMTREERRSARHDKRGTWRSKWQERAGAFSRRGGRRRGRGGRARTAWRRRFSGARTRGRGSCKSRRGRNAASCCQSRAPDAGSCPRAGPPCTC
jgi:hypothetical protein